MNFATNQHICETDKSKIVFKMIVGILLGFFVNNAQSNDLLSKVTHHRVEISGFAFIPKQLLVSKGDTITWINKDIVPHNIVDSKQKPISPDLATGENFTFVVSTPIIYKCGLHPSMKGKLSLSDSL